MAGRGLTFSGSFYAVAKKEVQCIRQAWRSADWELLQPKLKLIHQRTRRKAWNGPVPNLKKFA
jgi:hypothetical protein